MKRILYGILTVFIFTMTLGWAGDICEKCKARTATYIIAASNSLQHCKDCADYVCDGTDDQVEIQAAINALVDSIGGSIILMEGKFAITSPISLNSYISLSGLGYNTYLNSNQVTGQVIQVFGTVGTHKENVEISNLRISGVVGTAFGVYLHYCDNCKVRNLWVENAGQEGILLRNCSHCLIEGNNISGGWKDSDGIKLWQHVQNCIISNNHIKNMGINGAGPFTSDGIELQDSCFFNTIEGNTIDSCKEHGINLEGNTYYTTVIGNMITGVSSSGIEVVGSSNNNTISGNISQGNGRGIRIYSGCHHSVVNDNIVVGNTAKGIWINAANYITVTGNNVNSNGSHGIYAATMKYSNISNNILQGNTGYGINCVTCDSNIIGVNYVTGNSVNSIILDNVSDYNIIAGGQFHKSVIDNGIANTKAIYEKDDTVRFESGLPIEIGNLGLLMGIEGRGRMRNVFQFTLGYHLGADSIVVENGDTIVSPAVGMTFVDTTGGDTLKCFLNSAWEILN